MALVVEQYMDSLQNLPSELCKNLRQLRQLDESFVAKLSGAQQKLQAFVKTSKGGNKDTRRKKYDEIKQLFGSVRALGDEKVSLASQTYNMVDKHIQRLDADLVRFEEDIKRRLLGGDAPAESSRGRRSALAAGRKSAAGRAEPKGAAAAGRKRKAAAAATPKQRGRKKAAVVVAVDEDDDDDDSPIASSRFDALEKERLAELTGTALLQQLAGEGTNVLDMPVDPNEPTYCLCHQVSYGEMVGCDNAVCPVEWFHFGCVGLQSKPKGKWFCPRCTDERKKKQ